MQITILAFGEVAGVTGNNLLIKEDVTDTDSLKIILQHRYPALSNMNYAIAVDKKIIHENSVLADNTSVALLPPFSGG